MVLILMAIFVTENVSINKILFVFGGAVMLFLAECIFLPLSHIDLKKKEKKKKTDRRELLWLAIFFGTLLVLAVLNSQLS